MARDNFLAKQRRAAPAAKLDSADVLTGGRPQNILVQIGEDWRRAPRGSLLPVTALDLWRSCAPRSECLLLKRDI
jgi:hypothetical protein